jgi:hypothetical protein
MVKNSFILGENLGEIWAEKEKGAWKKELSAGSDTLMLLP